MPGWLRKAVVRGLAALPGDRHASMQELLDVLERKDAASRRQQRLVRVGGISATAMAMAGVALAGWIQSGAFTDRCAPSGRELVGIWDTEIKNGVRTAFLDTKLSYAEDTAQRVSARLDGYAAEWQRMNEQVCRAREDTKASRKVVELREHCLVRRKSQLAALTQLFVQSDAAVVNKAAQAAEALYPISFCADEKALLARVQPPEDPSVQARVGALEPRADRVEALLLAGKFKSGLSEGEALLAEVAAAGYGPLEARVLFVLGALAEGDGDFDRARQWQHQAALKATASKDDILAVKALAKLLQVVATQQQRVGEGQTIIDWSPFLVERTDDAEAQARWASAHGWLLLRQGKYEQGRVLLEKAVDLMQRALGAEHIDVASSLNGLGYALYALGKHDEAIAVYKRARAMLERILVPNHPYVASLLNNLGLALMSKGNLQESGLVYERAIAILEGASGLDHPVMASLLTNLCAVNTAAGRFESAVEACQRARSIRERNSGPDHAEIGTTLNNQAEALQGMGRHADAITVADQAVKQIERTLGASHPHVAFPLTVLARSLIALGRLDQAAAHLARAQTIRDKALGPEHTDHAGSLVGMAELHLARRKPVDAVTVLERALVMEREGHDVKLTLAEALWSANRDRERAVMLAKEVLAKAQRDANEPVTRRATTWLSQHVPPAAVDGSDR